MYRAQGLAILISAAQMLASPALAQAPKDHSCNAAVRSAVARFEALGIFADPYLLGKERGFSLAPTSQSEQSRNRLNRILESPRTISKISKPVLRSCRNSPELYICVKASGCPLKAMFFDDGRLLLLRLGNGPNDTESVIDSL